MLFSRLFAQVASAAPLIAPAINSSRAVPGYNVTDERTAALIRPLCTIGVTDGLGLQSELFVEGAIEALKVPHQGVSRSVADVSAGLVGGVHSLAGCGAWAARRERSARFRAQDVLLRAH